MDKYSVSSNPLFSTRKVSYDHSMHASETKNISGKQAEMSQITNLY